MLLSNTPSDMRDTSVVVHGSSLTSPAAAHDVDAVYIGDRETAERHVRTWAANRGLSHLPLDLHGDARRETKGSLTLVIPQVCGDEAPYDILRLRDGDTIDVRRYDRLSSHLRRKGVTAAAIHQGIMVMWRSRARLRVNLDEDRALDRPDWESYADVDGRRALASGIRHAKAHGVWDGLLAVDRSMYSTLAAIAEHGAARFVASSPPDVVNAVQHGGCTKGFPLDICATDVFGIRASVECPVVVATHAHAYMTRVCWRGWDALRRTVVEGAPVDTFTM